MKVKLLKFDIDGTRKYSGWLIDETGKKLDQEFEWSEDGIGLNGQQNLTVKDVTLFWEILLEQEEQVQNQI